MLGSTRVPLTPTKLPRQRRAWVTFDSILDATARLLQTSGYDGLTTNHIADRAGVAIGSLYEYFPDKETIIAELTRRTLREMMSEVESSVEALAKVGGERGLRFGLRLMFDVVESRRDLVRALWELPFLSQLEEVKAIPKAMFALTRQVVPAVDDHAFAENLDAASYLLTVMVGNAVVYGVTARPRRLSRRDVEETLAQMLVRMLRAHR